MATIGDDVNALVAQGLTRGRERVSLAMRQRPKFEGRLKLGLDWALSCHPGCAPIRPEGWLKVSLGKAGQHRPQSPDHPIETTPRIGEK